MHSWENISTSSQFQITISRILSMKKHKKSKSKVFVLHDACISADISPQMLQKLFETNCYISHTYTFVHNAGSKQYPIFDQSTFKIFIVQNASDSIPLLAYVYFISHFFHWSILHRSSEIALYIKHESW